MTRVINLIQGSHVRLVINLIAHRINCEDIENEVKICAYV